MWTMLRRWWVWIGCFLVAPIIAGIIYTIVAMMFWEDKGPKGLHWVVSFFTWIWSGVVAIWGGIIAVWNWTVAPVEIPRWWYGALLLCLILMIVRAVRLSYFRLCRSPREPTPFDYRRDQFLGVVWSWRYDRSGRNITAIAAFCPQCDSQLQLLNGAYHGDIMTTLHCHRHGDIDLHQNYERIQESIMMQIHDKIRSGEYQNVVRRMA